jgi:hypothetical protein
MPLRGGALALDPTTAAHAAGRGFDRAAAAAVAAEEEGEVVGIVAL